MIFGAFWCEPCVAELVDLQEVFEQDSDDGFIVLSPWGLGDNNNPQPTIRSPDSRIPIN